MSSSKPPPSTLTELQPGEFVDRYQLLYPIARGGMGTVWLARRRGHHGFEKHFVVKTVRPELAHDPALRTMFLDEIRITSAISHGNVAQVIDAGESRDLLYLVMEHIQGESLSRLAKGYAKRHDNGLLPPAIATRLILGACAGLHAAHELTAADGRSLQVVHRDVSPQNILVSVHGATKVIDFGIATARERLSQETSLGMLKGKLRFMAPEQIARKGVDRRTDLWALGCVLQVLLTGHGPFDEANEAAMLHRILGADRTPVPLSVPRPFARVIDACLDRDRENRPATADALGRLLEEAMREAGIAASESDVARLFGPIFKSSAAHANAAMATALAAIDDRARVQALLEPRTDAHSNLSPNFGPGGLRLTIPGSRLEASANELTSVVRAAPAPIDVGLEGSVQTATGVSRALPEPAGLAPSRSRRVWFAGGAALALGVGVAAFSLSARPTEAAHGAAAASPIPSASPPGSASAAPVAAAVGDAGALAPDTDAAAAALAADPSATPKASASKPLVVAKPVKPPSPSAGIDFSRRY